MLQAAESAVVSPTELLGLNYLPTELLLEIFNNVCFLDLDPLYAPCLPASRHSGPLLLSQICHLWRQMVVHEHHLWAFLYIKRTLPKALIQLFAERSEPLLFSLFWDTDKPSGDLNTEECRRWSIDTGELKTYLTKDLGHRLGDVHFYNAEQHAKAESYGTGRIRNVWDPFVPRYDTANLPWRPLPLVPQFRWSKNQSKRRQSLCWYPESTVMIPQLILRLSRLANFEVKGSYHIFMCKELLEAVAATIINAEFQAMRVGFPDDSISKNQKVVVLPIFERLTIHSASGDPTIVFPTLICPRMRSIRINCLGFTTDSADRLGSLIHRSGCHLSDLVIVDPTIGDKICELTSHPVFQKIQNGLFFVGNISEGKKSALERSMRWYLKNEQPSLWCGWGSGISWV